MIIVKHLKFWENFSTFMTEFFVNLKILKFNQTTALFFYKKNLSIAKFFIKSNDSFLLKFFFSLNKKISLFSPKK